MVVVIDALKMRKKKRGGWVGLLRQWGGFWMMGSNKK
jgi:hypothetical protein